MAQFRKPKKCICFNGLVLFFAIPALMLSVQACGTSSTQEDTDSGILEGTGDFDESESTGDWDESETLDKDDESRKSTDEESSGADDANSGADDESSGADKENSSSEDDSESEESDVTEESDESEKDEESADAFESADDESSGADDESSATDEESASSDDTSVSEESDVLEESDDSDDSDSTETDTDSPSNTDEDDSDTEDTDETVDTDTEQETEDSETTENNETSLYKKYQDYFPIGAAIDANSYRDGHAAIMTEHFNAAVCENEMKWYALQPSEGNFSFSQADQMVKFAEDNGMLVRGHTLVWFDQTPDWVFQNSSGGTVSKEVLLDRMRNHITTVMDHYKGRIYAWDVVNEAVTGNTSSGEDAGEDLSQVAQWGYRNSKWHQIAGEDHIIEAFRAARAADPDVKLFYNDFWNYLDDKRAFIITFIKKLQAENLIDGVGLQCHLNISVAQEQMSNQTIHQTVENLEKEIQEYAALGLDVHVTELDISIYTRDYNSSDTSRWYNEDTLNEDYQNRLAARYKEFFDMFRENSDLIQNVTLWGIADDNTWLSEFSSGRPDHPLLFDKYLQPKEAFYTVMDF